MRQELDFPQIEQSKLETVKQLIDSIVDNVTGDYSKELVMLSNITGKEHEPMEFAEYWSWTDLDTLARIAITPVPPYINDLTKNDVTDVIAVIKESLITGEDHRAEYYIELLHRSLPLTNVTDFILIDDNNEAIAVKMIKAASTKVICL